MPTRAAGGGIGLIVFGGFIGLFVWAAYSACQSTLSSSAFSGNVPSSGCGVFLAAGLFALFLIVVGIVVTVVSYRNYTYVRPSTNPAVPPPLINPVVLQQTVERQVVKVRCRYCGSLADPSDVHCPNCGATL
jgi:zinc-ribbon domain